LVSVLNLILPEGLKCELKSNQGTPSVSLGLHLCSPGSKEVRRSLFSPWCQLSLRHLERCFFHGPFGWVEIIACWVCELPPAGHCSVLRPAVSPAVAEEGAVVPVASLSPWRRDLGPMAQYPLMSTPPLFASFLSPILRLATCFLI
jgi:hypothetical protein